MLSIRTSERYYHSLTIKENISNNCAINNIVTKLRL